MRFDALLDPATPSEVAELAKAAEQAGFGRVRIPETRHEPFVMSALALAATRHIEVGTEVAIAFVRSPTVMAHAAWDLAALGGGRFRLGLGSQVRAHIERRYGMVWDSPVGRMREFVQALEAVWRCWQDGAPLRVDGRYYRLTLMTPFFNPGPIESPAIPVGLAGVNPPWARLAGEVAQAFHVHPLHTPGYLRDVLLPAIGAGLARGGKQRGQFEVVGSVFIITGRDESERAGMRQAVREQVAFYASTPSYRRVLEHHGWGELGERLSQLARAGRWSQMAAVVPDEMLDEVAVEAAPDELAGRIVERYGGMLDRVALYMPFRPSEWSEWWPRWAEGVQRSSG
ncbi:MAG: TIGR03617 family F420-dependent LLM class oxidoreductase [Bacillota bacterium]